MIKLSPYTYFAFLSCCLACNNINDKKSEKADTSTTTQLKFNEAKWKTKDGPDYPYRNQMLDNLIDSDTLKQLKRVEILDLLGEPDRIDSAYLFYRVKQKRITFFPLSTKTLVIKLSADSTVDWVKIHQ
jgi:hypothetical protein